MKKLAVLITLIMVFGVAVTNVSAENYFSVNAGVGWVDDIRLSDGIDNIDLSFDPGFGVSAALGHYYNKARIELEFNYLKSDLDEVELVGVGSASLSGDGTVMAVMLNSYYDFMAEHMLSPFLGGGIGYANAEIDVLGVKEDDDAFAYQLIAGIAFKLSERLKSDLQYRYFGTEDLEFDDSVDVDPVGSHSLMIGLRYGF